jgi:3-oxoacyl-[acyl-carrier-protein] synthase-1
MKTNDPVFLSALGILSALGRGKEQVSQNLFGGLRPGIVSRTDLLVEGGPIFVGQVEGPLPAAPANLTAYASRNFSLTIAAVDEIRADIENAVARYGRNRIAVVMGTCTSGIAEGELALKRALADGSLPRDFDIRTQEIGSTSEALARYLNLGGPAFTVSTACSSGAHALAIARRLIRTGLADAVLAGACDSLCRLTVNGFHALSALSENICKPFSRERDGITIGEGAVVFLMEKREAELALLGTGASTDAYSMTAPQPDGKGVELAIRAALNDAGLSPDAIEYVQLHGTGTLQNDAMESKVISRVFRPKIPCSSSKGQLGHTLGAAGAMGVAHCWLAARSDNRDRFLPPHLWDGKAEPGLLSDNLVSVGDRLDRAAKGIFMSNAIAFGGNNATLILGNPDR